MNLRDMMIIPPDHLNYLKKLWYFVWKILFFEIISISNNNN